MYLAHRNLGNKYKGRRRSQSIQPSRRHHFGCTDSTSLERTKLLYISRQTPTHKHTLLITDSITQKKRATVSNMGRHELTYPKAAHSTVKRHDERGKQQQQSTPILARREGETMYGVLRMRV